MQPAVGPEARFLWIGGFHYSGTSLVHLLLAERSNVVSALVNTSQWEDEGQHVQSVWPAYRDRRPEVCSPYTISLCLSAFDNISASKDQRARVLAEFQPYWNGDNLLRKGRTSCACCRSDGPSLCENSRS